MSPSNSFVQRTITGILFAALVLGLVYWSIWGYLILVTIIAGFGLLEWRSIFSTFQIPTVVAIGSTILLVSMLWLPFFIDQSLIRWALIWLMIALLFFGLIWIYPAQLFESITWVTSGFVYIILPLMLSVDWLWVEGYYLREWILVTILLIWMNDVFAYLVGSLLGRKPFYPAISPKKTWEGTAGGILLCGVLAVGLGPKFLALTMTESAILGIWVGVIATMGDLFESACKRYAGIKDSGTILPGHGGILDRFDSFLFVVPAVYVFHLFMG